MGWWLADMLRLVSLMIAWPAAAASTCPPGLLPDTFWSFSQYVAPAQQLELAVPAAGPGDAWSCLERLEADGHRLEVHLVAAAGGGQDCTGLRSCPGGRTVGCCSSCSAPAVRTAALAALRAAEQPVGWNYVSGSFALQLTEAACPTCNISRSWCSATVQLGREEGNQECLTEQATVLASEQEGGADNCSLSYSLALPLCTRVLPYTTVNVTVLTSDTNDSCESTSSIHQQSQRGVVPCTSATCGNLTSPTTALLEVTFEAEANLSYCLWVVPDTPVCREAECGVPVPGPPVTCTPLPLHASALPMSEPIFIGAVCSVLAACLFLLLCVVVKCQRDQTSPSSTPEPDMKKAEMGFNNMPRSLTIDEMEHICRLKQQEIVLVYFPDTEKFKNLNRMFKDWLLSLNILNVNHVTDIYDEKYADGADGVLSNPETWVSNLLSDPERRVVLVTSRLAYECLVHQRKGLAPPPFPGDGAYTALLAALLAALDGDMFRGNYRRLICVRYEDLKICDRRYGSESFNIVPGTEYLLPQVKICLFVCLFVCLCDP